MSIKCSFYNIEYPCVTCLTTNDGHRRFSLCTLLTHKDYTHSIQRVYCQWCKAIFNWTGKFCRVTKYRNSFCSQLCCGSVQLVTANRFRWKSSLSSLINGKFAERCCDVVKLNWKWKYCPLCIGWFGLICFLCVFWLYWWTRQAHYSSAELQTKMAATRRTTTTRCFLREKQLAWQNTKTNIPPTLQMFQMVWPFSKWSVKVVGWWWRWWWRCWCWKPPRLLSSTRGPRCPGSQVFLYYQ